MTVKRKLALGFTGVIGLLVILAVSAVFLIDKFNNNIDKIVNEDYQKIVLINRFSNEFSTLVKRTREAELITNDRESYEVLKNIDQARVDLEITMDSLNRIVVREQPRAVLKQLQTEYQKYISLLERSKGTDDSRQDHNKYLEETVQIQSDFFEYAIQLTDFYETEMQETTTQSIDLFKNTRNLIIFLSIVGIIIGVAVTLVITRNISGNLNRLIEGMKGFTEEKNDLSERISIKSKDEFGKLGHAFNKMIQWLQEKTESELKTSQLNQEQAWLKSNVAEIAVSLQGQPDLQALAKTLVSKVTPLVRGNLGILYIREGEGENTHFKLHGSYAFTERKNISSKFSFGEGLVGQCALEKETILLTQVPNDYIKITSGSGESTPTNIIVLPLLFKGKILGVLEIATFYEFSEIELEFLEQVTDSIGIVIENIQSQMRTEELLKESQILTEELQTQAEELEMQQKDLEQINAELEQQTKALRNSERTLQQQQEELEHNNTELEEKAQLLEEQNLKFEQKSREAEKAKLDAEEKAKQLELISKYKSEFLANMSHELRTPLNSLLILAKLLSENKEGNFTEKQVEFVKTIYSSGFDLLNLINDILDLSKVESGNMEVYKSRFLLSDVKSFVEDTFMPVATNKGVAFEVDLSHSLPKTIYTDKKRFEQILKNLLSNAFKFTEKGNVNLQIRQATEPELDKLSKYGLVKDEVTIAFAISDTGIGIPKDKREIIFEAFQQVDGTTSRKYEGTGLGLSISREFASMLGGFIEVHSSEGEGSTFTLYLPASYVGSQSEENVITNQELMNPYQVRQEVAASQLIDIDPVEEALENKVEYEAESLPVGDNEQKRILVVEDDVNQRNSIVELIKGINVDITSVPSGEDALNELKGKYFDCMVLDLGLADMSGYDLLEEIQKERSLHYMPVLIYTGKDLSSKDELRLKKHAKTIIMKDIYSPERLMEEIALILNKDDDDLLEMKIEHIQEISSNISHFEGKKILIVDDDIRNVFALSNMLETHNMEVLFAENGSEGIEILDKNPDIDLVLMDIMMPEMDGYEATQKIRNNPEFQSIPIIALTAKAMKDDRKKCLDAGASDYIAKPINNDQLLALMRVWLYK